MASSTAIMQLHSTKPWVPFRGRDQRVCRALASSATATPTKITVTKPTIFDSPASNNGARIRYLLYAKGIESGFDFVHPNKVGGVKGEAYLALNPQGKFPLLLFPDGTALPESEVIAQYIEDKYRGTGPSFTPATPELRAKAALITRIMDIYVVPIQGCMYKKMDAATRADQIKTLAAQLDNMEKLVDPQGPWLVGDSFTTADAALFPTFVFFTYILTKKFGWKDVFAGRPKLHRWWAAVNQDPVAVRVIKEISDALDGWGPRNVWKDSLIEEQVANHKEYKWAY